MLVQLDEETWEMSDTSLLEEVLANLSDRAQAQGRLVTELIVGNRPMTDRELVPLTLAKAASSFGTIAAKSECMDNIVQYSEETGKKFGQQIRVDAQQLVEESRCGKKVVRKLDQWCGQFADYLEWAQIQYSVKGGSEKESQQLAHWANELMQARQESDEVRMTDMLEYEIIPRLPQQG